MTYFPIPTMSRQFVRLSSIFVLFMFLIACRSETPVAPNFSPVQGIGGDPRCLFANTQSNAIVVRNLADFEPYRECTTSPSDFDFVRYSLVAVLLQGSGCEIPTFAIIDFMNDEQNRKISITVEVDQVGNCASLHQAIRWIAVDPVPENYEVLVQYVRK